MNISSIISYDLYNLVSLQYFGILLPGLLTVIYYLTRELNNRNGLIIPKFYVVLVIIYLFIIIGLSPYVGDKLAYYFNFARITEKSFIDLLSEKDPLFYIASKSIISLTGSIDLVFVFFSAVYILGYYFFSLKVAKQHAIFFFLVSVSFFFFIQYGINTIRAGLASIAFLFALSNYRSRKIILCILLLIISFLLHKSFLIPVLSLFVTKYSYRTMHYIYVWCFCLVLSISVGGALQGVLANYLISSDDIRAYQYLTESNENYNQGFRFDFVLFSIAPVIFIMYRYKYYILYDLWFSRIFNAYILTNAFWLLIIRANFTDRFAYLSWVMLPIVLLIPVLSESEQKGRIYAFLVLLYAISFNVLVLL